MNSFVLFSPPVFGPLNRIRPTKPPNLIRESVLASSGLSSLPIAVAEDRTVVLPIKSNV
ncbi:hypothetical protein A2U01_0092507, partial [Trifolium medium]|nr:hypothetical protein [Trifolium medium]